MAAITIEAIVEDPRSKQTRTGRRDKNAAQRRKATGTFVHMHIHKRGCTKMRATSTRECKDQRMLENESDKHQRIQEKENAGR
jgi:hypothetical protein